MATDRRMVGFWTILILAVMAFALGGGVRAWAIENGAEPQVMSVENPATSDNAAGDVLEAQAAPASDSEAELDPWEKFNEPMFRFNKEVDRLIIKPIATGWDRALPDSFQRGLHNAFDNLQVIRRVMNNLFQLKPVRAGRELARFTINSTIGYVGFLDVAKDYFGIQQADEDFGQTLGVWGAKPGPYLVLPLVPEPMTIRDGAGKVVDTLMFPPTWFWPVGFAFYVTDGINERSLNLDRFQRVEESVIDLYSAVRNAYMQRRAAAIRE